jgi:tyrosyl-tRNA synthetase
MPEIVSPSSVTLPKFLKDAGIISSSSEVKRLILQGGIKIDDETVTDAMATVEFKGGEILKIGKRKFYRIVVRS